MKPAAPCSSTVCSPPHDDKAGTLGRRRDLISDSRSSAGTCPEEAAPAVLEERSARASGAAGRIGSSIACMSSLTPSSDPSDGPATPALARALLPTSVPARPGGSGGMDSAPAVASSRLSRSCLCCVVCERWENVWAVKTQDEIRERFLWLLRNTDDLPSECSDVVSG